MKKIIKLGILGSLILTSTFAIALPIVSCSGSTNTNNITNIEYSTGYDINGEVRRLFASTDIYTEMEKYNALAGLHTSGSILNIVNNYLIIKSGSKILANTIESITVNIGKYPVDATGKPMRSQPIPPIQIITKLKSEYKIPENLNSKLDFEVSDLKISSPKIGVTVDWGPLTEIENEIKRLIGSGDALEQETEYKNKVLKTNISEGTIFNLVKKILTIRDRDAILPLDQEVDGKFVLKSIDIVGPKWNLPPNNIPPTTIKLNLGEDWAVRSDDAADAEKAIVNLGKINKINVTITTGANTNSIISELSKIIGSDDSQTQKANYLELAQNDITSSRHPGLYNAIVNYFTVKNKSNFTYTSSEAIPSVSISVNPNSWPQPGQPIPGFNITAKLFEGRFNPDATSGAKLTFPISSIGNNVSPIGVTVALGALDELKNAFKTLIGGETSDFNAQKENFNNLIKTHTSGTIFEAVKKYVSINDRIITDEIKYEDAIQSVIVSKKNSDATLSPNGAIPDLNISVTLDENKYIVKHNEQSLRFSINNLGNFQPIGLIVTQGANIDGIVNAIKSYIKTDGSNWQSEENLFNNLLTIGRFASGDIFNAVKNYLSFKDSNNATYTDAIKWVEVSSATADDKYPAPGEEIQDLKLVVALNNSYKAKNNTELGKLTFVVTGLGKTSILDVPRSAIKDNWSHNNDAIKNRIREYLGLGSEKLSRSIQVSRVDVTLREMNVDISSGTLTDPLEIELFNLINSAFTIQYAGRTFTNVVSGFVFDIGEYIADSVSFPNVKVVVSIKPSFTMNGTPKFQIFSDNFVRAGHDLFTVDDPTSK